MKSTVTPDVTFTLAENEPVCPRSSVAVTVTTRVPVLSNTFVIDGEVVVCGALPSPKFHVNRLML